MQLQEKIHFLHIKNKKLRVQELKHTDRKKASRPPLVFLHEGLGCIELWKDFPALLANATGLDAIVYDRQGYGHSDTLDLPRPMNYLEIEALEYLPELLKKLNIKSPILVGHSDGGSIALVYAGHYPTTALITEAAHIFVEAETLEGVAAAKNNSYLLEIKEKLKKYHGEKTEDIFSAWVDTWLNPEFRHWNIESELSGIKCPALVIQGMDDEYATALQVEKILEGMPEASYKEAFMPENCAHSPHLQAKDTILQRMTSFIEKVLGK